MEITVVASGGELGPGDSAISRPKNPVATNCVDVRKALSRARIEYVRIVRIHHQRADREICHQIVCRRPGISGIRRSPHAATHSGSKNTRRIYGVDHQASRSAANVARPERRPASVVGVQSRGGPLFPRCHGEEGGAGRHAGDLAESAGSCRSQLVELSQRARDGILGHLAVVIAQCAKLLLEPRSRTIGDLALVQHPGQTRLGHLSDRFARATELRAQLVHHLFAELLACCLFFTLNHDLSLLSWSASSARREVSIAVEALATGPLIWQRTRRCLGVSALAGAAP